MAEDEVPAELIETIPEVAGDAQELPFEVIDHDGEPPTVYPSTFAATLEEMRRHFEATIQNELSQVESSMGAAFADLNAALQAREAEVREAREELEVLRAQHAAAERKLEALKAALRDS